MSDQSPDQWSAPAQPEPQPDAQPQPDQFATAEMPAQYAPAPPPDQFATAQQPAQYAPAPQSVVIAQQPVQQKSSRVPLIVASVVAVAGLGFGAFAWSGKQSAEDRSAELSSQVATLEADVQAEADKAAELEASLENAQADVENLEADVQSAEEAQATAEADLESTQLELDEMIAEQEADDRIDEALEGSANDGVLTAGEFAVAQDLFGEQLANITLEQASELGAKVCEVQTEADLVPLLREAQALIGPESTFEDAALVLGGVAGLMCADHLQDLA